MGWVSIVRALPFLMCSVINASESGLVLEAFESGKVYEQLMSAGETQFRVNPGAAVISPPGGTTQLQPRLGVNIHFVHDDKALDIVRDVGIGFVRMDLEWSRVERNGQYDFGVFDDLMRALEARGLGVLWILDYGHPQHGGRTPASPADIAAYGRFAAAVASHFRGHSARFEIWNEPNLKDFLPDGSVYPKLLTSALEAIRREDSGAEVSTGGVSRFDFPFLKRVLATAATRKATAIGIHPYRDTGPETVAADLSALRDLVRKSLGNDVPIWDTEWGYSSYGFFGKYSAADGHSETGRKRQAVMAAREWLTTWALGFPVAVWYDLRDDGNDAVNREHNFGLLQQDNSDKPSMKALRTLIGLSRNRRYAGFLKGVPSGLHVMRLDGDTDLIFIVWVDQPSMPINLRLPKTGFPSVVNVVGESLAPNTQGETLAMRVTEQDGPVYVKLRRK